MGVLNIVPMNKTDPDLPVLIKAGPSKDLTTTTSSATTTIPEGGAYIRLLADEAMYVRLGGSTLTAAAGDFRLAPNIPEYVKVGNDTHLAALDVE